MHMFHIHLHMHVHVYKPYTNSFHTLIHSRPLRQNFLCRTLLTL